MKKILVVIMILSGPTAFASWMQEECSNGDASIRRSSGHTSNKLVVTEFINRTRTPVEVDLRSVKVEVLKEQKLESTSHKSCRPGDASGFGSWKNLSAEKVTITKTDGSTFSKDTLGVSQDLKSIETTWICEHNGNSMIMCK